MMNRDELQRAQENRARVASGYGNTGYDEECHTGRNTGHIAVFLEDTHSLHRIRLLAIQLNYEEANYYYDNMSNDTL